jgi:hypothetical protein
MEILLNTENWGKGGCFKISIKRMPSIDSFFFIALIIVNKIKEINRPSHQELLFRRKYANYESMNDKFRSKFIAAILLAGNNGK